MQTNIGLFLAKRAQLEPTKIGLIFDGREITYKDWNERTNRAAHGFASLGVNAGDRVGLLLMNSPELLECFFGLARIGAVIVPLNWRLAPPELAFIANAAGISALAYGSDFAETVATIKNDLQADTFVAICSEAPKGEHAYEKLLAGQPATVPQTVGVDDDPLVIMYTSGTTGRPKGAVLTHNNLFYDSCTVSFSMDWRTGDLGRFDEEGFLYIMERKRDMLISGGENIYPAEIENVLAGIAQIAEAAVIGVPDSQWGEVVCVVARLKKGETLTLDEVIVYCTGKLGTYKMPKKLILTDDPLPRTAAGKVLKRLLREKFAN